MRFLVLGGGACGVAVIRELLHHYKEATIIVYVRSPEKLPADLCHNRSLVILKGQLTDADGLSKALEGVHVVISALGPGPSHPSGNPIAKGFELLIDQMKGQGVKRLIVLATPMIKDPRDNRSFICKTMILTASHLVRTACTEMIAIGEVIRTMGEDLDWTIVRVNQWKNDNSKEVIVGYLGDRKTKWAASRKGFAAFVVHEIETGEWVKKTPLVTSA
ncbi:NAD(P)-binding protein [Coprinopsis sp. MPI-PUGE-AT-0042]|nr:NAD(P)-binding protein [Coprinopsis sp. MPI-PUGE-AT-0042]